MDEGVMFLTKCMVNSTSEGHEAQAHFCDCLLRAQSHRFVAVSRHGAMGRADCNDSRISALFPKRSSLLGRLGIVIPHRI